MDREYQLEDLGPIIGEAKKIAKQYYQLTGKPLGITGEIAEYEAARLMNLRLAQVRQAGYDAIRVIGASIVKYQIKGRCLHGDANPGRLGRIRLEHEWDVVLLVLLDEDYEPTEIYEAQRRAIQAALLAPGSISRNERGSLSISGLKSIGQKVWPGD